MTHRRILAAGIALAATFAAPAALASHERFHKETAESTSGFVVVKDATYLKECGSCHFAYTPGLLPARSWELHMQRMEKHFGESVVLPPATRDAIQAYLVANAADRSPFEGSKYFMSRVKDDMTPYKLQDVPLFREMHRIILEVISIKSKVKVRTLTNCNACHQFAAEGSYATAELVVPGLTPAVRTAR